MSGKSIIQLGLVDPTRPPITTAESTDSVRSPSPTGPAPGFAHLGTRQHARRAGFLAISGAVQALVIGGFIVRQLTLTPPPPEHESPRTVRTFMAPPPPPPPLAASPAPSAPRAPAASVPVTASFRAPSFGTRSDRMVLAPAPLDHDPFAGTADTGFGVVNGTIGGLGSAPVTSAPPAPSGPLRIAGDITPPERTHYVPPVYPRLAADARVEGVVIVEASIDRTGRVCDIRVLRSIPALDRAAIEAVRQWRYKPTLVSGVAVPIVMSVTVAFKLV